MHDFAVRGRAYIAMHDLCNDEVKCASQLMIFCTIEFREASSLFCCYRRKLQQKTRVHLSAPPTWHRVLWAQLYPSIISQGASCPAGSVRRIPHRTLLRRDHLLLSLWWSLKYAGHWSERALSVCVIIKLLHSSLTLINYSIEICCFIITTTTYTYAPRIRKQLEISYNNFYSHYFHIIGVHSKCWTQQQRR